MCVPPSGGAIASLEEQLAALRCECMASPNSGGAGDSGGASDGGVTGDGHGRGKPQQQQAAAPAAT